MMIAPNSKALASRASRRGMLIGIPRELVGGRHVDKSCAIGYPVDLDALGIHRHTGDIRPHRHEQLARRAVAGVFHGDHAARLQHHAGDQVQRLLCAVGDDDVAVAAVDPA